MGTFDRAIAPVASPSRTRQQAAATLANTGSRLKSLAHVIESSPVARRDAEVRIDGSAVAPLAQLAAAARVYRPPAVQRRAANRTGLPDGLNASAEARSGVSLDDVKVHDNSGKPSQLQAHAYAQGSNIYLAPGQERHLPHETGHVAQQKKGLVVSTRHLSGVPLNDDPRLEAQADGFGRDMARQGGIAQRMEVASTARHFARWGQSTLSKSLRLRSPGSISFRPFSKLMSGIRIPTISKWPTSIGRSIFDIFHRHLNTDNHNRSLSTNNNLIDYSNKIMDLVTELHDRLADMDFDHYDLYRHHVNKTKPGPTETSWAGHQNMFYQKKKELHYKYNDYKKRGGRFDRDKDKLIRRVLKYQAPKAPLRHLSKVSKKGL